MLMEAATRVDDVYNPPNGLEFGAWTASMGRLTSNPDGWEKFFFAIRRAEGMVLFIENFKSLLHSQVQQAAQEAGLVVRRASHLGHTRELLAQETERIGGRRQTGILAR